MTLLEQGRLNQMTNCGPFQPYPHCDSVKTHVYEEVRQLCYPMLLLQSFSVCFPFLRF